MKARLISQLITIFYILIVVSCVIHDEDEDYFNGTMQAQINDELIIFTEVYGERHLNWQFEWSRIQHIVGNTEINVSGGYGIRISFPFNPTVGNTYHPSCMCSIWIGSYDEDNLTGYYTKDMKPSSSEASSILKFTSITNSSYQGTFSFTAYDNPQNPNDSIVVTNGKFEIDSDGKKW